MIVKNEERCIERCLDSVSSFVSEIIVVDTGSSDRTVELIKKYNPRVFHYEWDNNFSNARNYAIEQATGDYILQLDGDEWIDDKEDLLKDTLDRDIYYLPIRNDLGQGVVENNIFPRMFRNLPEFRYEGAIHEQINITKHSNRSSAVLKHVIIHHDGYLTSIIEEKDKHNRNLKILLEESKTNPSVFNYYNLGQQYFTMAKYQKAIEFFRKAYQSGGEYSFTKGLLLSLIRSLIMLKKYDEALSIAKDCSTLYSDFVEFKYYQGIIYQEMGYLYDAEECYKACLAIGDSDTSIHYNTFEGTGSYLAYARLSEIALASFDKQKANEYIVQAIQKSPKSMGFLRTFLKINAAADAKTLYEKIMLFWPKDENILQLIIKALLDLRHPVLLEFNNTHKINMDTGVQAYIHLLQKEYGAAKTSYLQIKDESIHYTREILLTAFILSDVDLLEKFLDLVSIRQEEQKLLKKIILKQDFTNNKFSKEFDNIMEGLLAGLLRLQEYDYVDYFAVNYSSSAMRYRMAKVTYEFGFYEIALSLLIEGNSNEEKYNNNLLAARCLRQLGSLEDSLYYYIEAFNNKAEVEIAFHINDIAKILNREDIIQTVSNVLLNLYPVSEWASRLEQEKSL